MKISLNWMKWYGGQGLDAPTEEIVDRIGSQLGEIESVDNLGDKYRGAVVVKVVNCGKHPNADKLSVCTIDDGGIAPDVTRDENGHVQVVCGAPNVKAGAIVVWLPPGATVPDSVGKEPFVLEARELRGVISNGMLASPKELALGESHEGLLLLDDDKQPGSDFAEAYELNDTIIDIENKMFTHRPDCFGQLGVAREIAGIFGKQFTSPDWYKEPLALDNGEGLQIEISNELPSLVPRFMVVGLSEIEIKPSPLWLQTYLLRLGVRPISNVVDITNYIMLLTGQPLHAYDYDKVKALSSGDGAILEVRNPRESEKIKLLNGKELDPRQEAIMIATDKAPIGLGGIMGGADTEVNAGTKNIILEAATFDMYSVRRSSMEHGIFTDGVTRFSKGQSPLQNDRVLAKAVEMLQEFASARVASATIDDNHVEGRQTVHPPVPVSADFINARLGFKLSADEMRSILQNVEFEVKTEGDNLTVTAPFWRTDIETREDIVEEVGRLYGFDKLPLELPVKTITPAAKDRLIELKSRIRENLAKSGANEVLTYSFVHGNLFDKVGQDKNKAFKLGNALSPDLQYYRLSLTSSLLEKIHPNIKAGYDRFAIFEIGKGHNLDQIDEGLPTEFEMLELVYAATNKALSVGAAYYQALRLMDALLGSLGIEYELRPMNQEEPYEVAKPYDHTRAAQVWSKDGKVPLGMVGEYKTSVRRQFKLSSQVAGFGLGLLQLQQVAGTTTDYKPLSRFPKVSQDLTLKVAADVSFGALEQVLREVVTDQASGELDVQLTSIGIYQAEGDSGHKNISFHLDVANHQKTLTEPEVSVITDALAAAAKEKLEAERV